MMNEVQYYLGKVAEEAIEVAKEALKAQQFGLDTVEPGKDLTNAERICREMDDLNAMLKNVSTATGGRFDYRPSQKRQFDKHEKVEKYIGISRVCGMVEPEQQHIDLSKGQFWLVRLPDHRTLDRVRVVEVTERTVMVSRGSESPTSALAFNFERYVTAQIEWIEKILTSETES